MKKSFIMCLMTVSLSVFITGSAFGVSWVKNIDDGFKVAEAQRCAVMIDFYTDWCGWCKKLDSDTYPDPRVQELSGKFVCIKVNGDKLPNFVAKYLIEGYPTLVFLDPDGKEISRIVGYVSANELSEKMAGIAAKYPGTGAKKAEATGWKEKIGELWSKAKDIGKAPPERDKVSRSGGTLPPQSAPVSVAPEREAVVSEQAAPVSGSAVVYKDLILMNNGSRMQGIVKEERSDSYIVKLPLGEVTLKKTDVKEIKQLPAEEACLNMGDRLAENHDFDKAMEEYRKALGINPGFKPAADAIAVLKRKKLDYEEKQKALREESENEPADAAQPAAAPAQPVPNHFSYGLDLMDRDQKMSGNYAFADFGITVDVNLRVNGFVTPDVYPSRDRVKNISPANSARSAGIRPGDRIIMINGKNTDGLGPFAAEKLIGSHRYIKIVVER